MVAVKVWHPVLTLILGLAWFGFPVSVFAAEYGTLELVEDWVGIVALILFAAAYVLVVVEEFTHLPLASNNSRWVSPKWTPCRADSGD